MAAHSGPVNVTERWSGGGKRVYERDSDRKTEILRRRASHNGRKRESEGVEKGVRENSQSEKYKGQYRTWRSKMTDIWKVQRWLLGREWKRNMEGEKKENSGKNNYDEIGKRLWKQELSTNTDKYIWGSFKKFNASLKNNGIARIFLLWQHSNTSYKTRKKLRFV